MSSTDEGRYVGENVRLAKKGTIAGSGLFATRSISAGELVHCVTSPLLATPDNDHLEECCARCLLWLPSKNIGKDNMQTAYSNSKLYVCKGCSVLRYCGVDCQKADWKDGHKLECGTYKKVYPKILPSTVRMAIRLFNMNKKGLILPLDWQEIMQMQSHTAKFHAAGGEVWDAISTMCMGVILYSEERDEDFVKDVYCKFLVNSFTATTPMFDPIGVAFDGVVSHLNHSCSPNIILVLDKRTVSLRSLRDIAANEELTISYIDNTNPSWYRQRELRKRYFFNCLCEACTTRPNEIHNPSNQVKEQLDLNIQISTKVTKLLNQYPDQGKEIQEWINQSEESLKSLKRDVPNMSLTYQPIPTLHHQLAQAHLVCGKWAKAFIHEAILYVTSDAALFTIPFHPVRVCRNFTLALVLLEVSATSPASFEIDYTKILYGLLVEVAGNVDKSHGSESSFAGMVKRKMKEVETDIGIDGGEEVKKWLGKGLSGIPGLDKEVGKLKGVVKEEIGKIYGPVS